MSFYNISIPSNTSIPALKKDDAPKAVCYPLKIKNCQSPSSYHISEKFQPSPKRMARGWGRTICYNSSCFEFIIIRWAHLQEILTSWQQYRNQEQRLSNWLYDKEKSLKEISVIDMGDQNEVQKQIQNLKVIYVAV